MGALDLTLILVPLLGVRTTYRPVVALAEVVLVELAHLSFLLRPHLCCLQNPSQILNHRLSHHVGWQRSLH